MTTKALSTGVITTDTLVFNGKTFINGIIAGGDGTNIATITAYDNTTASGKVLLKLIVPAGVRQVIAFPVAPIQAPNGLFVSISGTGAEAQVYHGA